MTSFGAHAFIWTGDWTRDGAHHAIEGASEAALDFLEIPLVRPAAVDVAWTRSLIRTHQLDAYASLGLPPDSHLPHFPANAESFLRQALETASHLGAPALTGVIYGHIGTLTGQPPEEQERATIATVLKRVARAAAELGMSLGIEPVNRYETYLLNMADQALDLLHRIDEPNVFLHLDTYHMNIEEKGMYDPIVRAGSHLGYIHLSESDRGIPGTGNVDWDEVFRGLRDIGYSGPLAMESFAAINPDLARATALWRDVVGDPDRLIRDGLGFLRAKADAYGLLEDGAS